MDIGVDATCWQNTRGYGRHARSLLSALINLDSENRYFLFLDSADHIDTLPTQAEVRLVGAKVAPTAVAASSNGHRSIVDMWHMSRSLSSADLDVLIFPTIYSYVPVLTRAKKITIIHDVIAEKYPDLTMPGLQSRLFWKTKTALGRWQADAVATVSDYSRRGLVEEFGLDPDSIHVIGEASDPVFRVLESCRLTNGLKSLGLSESQRMVVYVGGFGPHKNVRTLISAFAELACEPKFADTRLVLVGEHQKEVFHSHAETIKQLIKDLGLTKRVVFTGFLPDDELVVLLNLATVSVLPSLIEGFGLPAVEAAACGCPVIATKESPLPELLGEGGIYFEPLWSEELATALRRVLDSESLRRNMGEAGRKAANQLTWNAAANQLSELIHKVTA